MDLAERKGDAIMPVALGHLKCGNCVFWDPEGIKAHSKSPDFIKQCLDEHWGFCRCTIPQAGFPPWPITQLKEWCVSHEEKDIRATDSREAFDGKAGSIDIGKVNTVALLNAVNKMVAHCPTCGNRGVLGGMIEHDGITHPGGRDVPCPTCLELRAILNGLRI